MKFSDKPAIATAQTRLMEIFVAAGWTTPERAATLLPWRVTRVVLTTPAAATIDDLPDDDFRLTTESGGICDPRRQWRRPGIGSQWVVALAKVGDWVRVDCFDGWGNGATLRPWACYVFYDGAAPSSHTGGVSATFTSTAAVPNPRPSDYYTTGPHFADYRQNGGFIIAPPAPYPMPSWWAGKAYNSGE